MEGKLPPPHYKGALHECSAVLVDSSLQWWDLPSFNMPTLRHFMKRQAWHDLRLLLVISHSFVAGQLYSMFPVRKQQSRMCCRVDLMWTNMAASHTHCYTLQVLINMQKHLNVLNKNCT